MEFVSISVVFFSSLIAVVGSFVFFSFLEVLNVLHFSRVPVSENL